MKRLISLSVLSLLCFIRIIAGTSIVYMNVGDTRTLSFSAPTYVVGTQWTISDQDALQFSPTPGSMAVTATVKALKARSAANRVIVHCTYYYRELNPTNGKYEYQRTGYQDWEVIIRDSGSGGGGGNESGTTVSMYYKDCSLKEGEILNLSAYASDNSYTGNYKWTSSNPDVLSIEPIGANVKIKAKSQGTSYLRVTIDNGNYDEIKVTVHPRYELEYTLTSDGNGYAVSSKNQSAKGEIIIPSTYNNKPVTEIKEHGFYDCTSITSVIIPNSVTTIGGGAFFNSGIQSVTIGNSVTTIESNAFSWSRLNSVTIPKSVTSISKCAFYVCAELETVCIEDANIEIPSMAFTDCKKLTKIDLGDSITSIGSSAFSGCESLREIILPETVTAIGVGAFDRCNSLKTITIPKGVRTLSFPLGFGSCESLTDIIVDPDNVACCSVDGILYNKSKTTLYGYPGGRNGAFVIPSGVTSLESSAFRDCRKLTSIVMHNELNSLGNYVFEGCTQLSKIIDSRKTPQSVKTSPFGVNEINGWVPLSASIYIPKGTVEAYKEAAGWNRFSDFREMGTVDIKFSDATVKLNIGESFTPEVYTDADSDVIIKSTVWESQYPSIVSVDAKGNVMALSEGKARIY